MPTNYGQGGVMNGPFTPQQAEGGYVPRAYADQGNNTLAFNVDNRATQLHGNPRNNAYDRFVVAHELGHLAAQQRLPDEATANSYLSVRNGAVPGPEVPRSPFGHLPLAAQGQTTHQAPNEQYANDFAAALGFRNRGGGELSAATKRKKLKFLQQLGILPR